MDGRTEAPTQKRKKEARQKGMLPRSVELPQAVSLVAGVLLLPVVLPRVGDAMAKDWQLAVGGAATSDPQAATALLGRFFVHATLALVPLLVVLAVSGVITGVAMVGMRPNLTHLRPKFERINPKQGIKRLVGKQVLWELLRIVLKLALLTLLAWGAWKAGFARLLAGPSSADRVIATIGSAAGSMLQRVALLGALIGIADVVVARRRHGKQLRMTKHEVKEEHRQTEGNPHVKAEIRKKHMKMSRMRMIAEVARADVVLTNPTHLAVALAYEPGSVAPVVVAKGAGEVARRIREEAARHRVPIKEHKPLARALYRSVEIGDPIPVALYRAVAEILAAVYRARRRAAA